MPLVGFFAGEYLYNLIGHAGEWVAALILFGIGAHIIWQQFFPDKVQFKGDPTRGASLLALMFATSIDALAAGISLALQGVVLQIVCHGLSTGALFILVGALQLGGTGGSPVPPISASEFS